MSCHKTTLELVWHETSPDEELTDAEKVGPEDRKDPDNQAIMDLHHQEMHYNEVLIGCFVSYN